VLPGPRRDEPSHLAGELLVAGREVELVLSLEPGESIDIAAPHHPAIRGKGEDGRQEPVADAGIAEAELVLDGKIGKARQHLAGEEARAAIDGSGLSGRRVDPYSTGTGGGGAALEDEPVDRREPVQELRDEGGHLGRDVPARRGLEEPV